METCEFCKKTIDESERAMLWQELVTCEPCYWQRIHLGGEDGDFNEIGFAWPGTASERVDWLAARGVAATLISKCNDAGSRLHRTLTTMRACGFVSRARPLMDAAIALTDECMLSVLKPAIWMEAATHSMELGDVDRAGAWLKHTADFANQLTDGAAKSYCDRSVKTFGTYLGLLDAVRPLNPREQRHAKFRRLTIQAKREIGSGQIHVARQCLAEAVPLLPSTGKGWEGKDCRCVLFCLLAETGDRQAAKAVYSESPAGYLPAWWVEEALWQIGDHAECRRLLQVQLAQSETEAARDKRSALKGFEYVAQTQHQMGFYADRAQTLARLQALTDAWSLEGDSLLRSAVLATLGSIHVRAGDCNAAAPLLNAAKAAVDARASSPLPDRADPAVVVSWATLSRCYAACGALDLALDCARCIDHESTRISLVATAYVKTRKQAKLRQLLATIKSAYGAHDILRSIDMDIGMSSTLKPFIAAP